MEGEGKDGLFFELLVALTYFQWLNRVRHGLGSVIGVPSSLCHALWDRSAERLFLFLQIVEVLEEEEEGWWRGKIGSSEGVFPSNFVEELAEEENKPQPVQAQPVQAQPVHHPSPGPDAVDSQTGERTGGWALVGGWP